MALVELARFDNGFEADLARARLEDEGIPAFLFDTGMSWIGSAVPVRVMVDDSDEAAARALLSRDRDG